MGQSERKRVLVTGGAGFIGSHLIRELSRLEEYEITAVDNESVGSFGKIAGLGANCINADIRDSKAMSQAMRDVEFVVHLAADTGVLDSIADPKKNFEVNAFGSLNLLCLARDAGVRAFIAASTGGAILGDASPPVHESMAPRPLSPYGASKLAMEGYLSAFSSSYGMRTASLRFSNIYGPLSRHKGSVIAQFLRQIQRGEEVVVYGDGTQVRDFLYVGDLVNGIHKCLASGFNGILQLGSGQPTSIRELIVELNLIVGDQLKVRYDKFRSGEVRATWCDITQARNEIAFAPDTSLPAGLRLTWDWFCATQNSKVESKP